MKFLLITLLWTASVCDAETFSAWVRRNCDLILRGKMFKVDNAFQFSALQSRIENVTYTWARYFDLSDLRGFFPAARVFHDPVGPGGMFQGEMFIRIVDGQLRFFQTNFGSSRELLFLGHKGAKFTIRKAKIRDERNNNQYGTDVVSFEGPDDLVFTFHFLHFPHQMVVGQVHNKATPNKNRNLFIFFANDTEVRSPLQRYTQE